jgi:hypothetical protein
MGVHTRYKPVRASPRLDGSVLLKRWLVLRREQGREPYPYANEPEDCQRRSSGSGAEYRRGSRLNDIGYFFPCCP